MDMERPEELTRLLAELADEKPESPALRLTPSGARFILVVEDTDSRFEFNREESLLLLSTPETVERLHDALGNPVESYAEMYRLTPDQPTLAALEKIATVDEL